MVVKREVGQTTLGSVLKTSRKSNVCNNCRDLYEGGQARVQGKNKLEAIRVLLSRRYTKGLAP